MDNTTNTTPVTLESIAQKKAMLLQEIRLQKEIMTGLTQEIFAPLEPATNKANAMMRAFNTGMAVFDGIVLGGKVNLISSTKIHFSYQILKLLPCFVPKGYTPMKYFV